MPRKMRSSFGCVQRLDRDRYRLRWWADTPQGRKRKTEIVRGTRREAERRMAEIRVAATERRAPTIGELWEGYELPHLKSQLKLDRISKRTFQAYTRRWEADVAPRWADVPADQARPSDIQAWLLTMTKSMGELSKAVLSLVFERGVLMDLVTSNPCARRYDYGEQTSREKAVYSMGELDEVWKAVRGTVAEAPFLLSAFAGLRVGEACGMARADIEPQDGCCALHVRRQLTPAGVVSERLKTRGSERTAVILDPWAARLLEISGETYINEDRDGTPVHRRTVAENWKRALLQAGLPYRSMQCLRPSYQTNMHWAGMPIEQTSRLLGHASKEMTLSNYDRPTDEQLVNMVLSHNAQKSG